MDAKTLKALKASIAHWEEVEEGPWQQVGPKECALCDLFYGSKCEGCPVAIKAQAPLCRNTPYGPFISNRTSKNARAELDFLRSLLPEGEK